MATAPQIALLRQYINEPDDVEPFDEVSLSTAIDVNAGDVEKTASQVWSSKASGYAELVDIQEGTSKRSLGSLHGQALSMAKFYHDRSPENTGQSRRRVGTRAIERP